MLGKKRQVSQRSLDNLKLGAEARRQDKQRHNFTLLPETVVWLKATGNASDTIDALVKAARSGGLISNNTHKWKEDEQVVSNNTYERISYLEKENEQIRSDLEKQKEVIALLQKAITPTHQGGLYKSNTAKPLKEAVEKALSLLDRQNI